jgi:hypothetical protein
MQLAHLSCRAGASAGATPLSTPLPTRQPREDRAHRRRWPSALTLVAVVSVVSSGADPARALSGAEAVVDAAHAYAAHIQVGRGRACSGTLVSPRWLLTTRSCLAQGSTPLSAGPPPVPATASVGRASLSAPGGHSLDIVEVLPHPERNVALAKLARPLRDIEPIRVASIAPIQGELVEALGYATSNRCPSS